MCTECVQGAPIALRMAKAAINKGMDVDLQTAYALEHSYYAQVPIPADAKSISCASDPHQHSMKGYHCNICT